MENTMTQERKIELLTRMIERQSRRQHWKFNANYDAAMYEQSWGHGKAYSRLWAIRRNLMKQVQS
jgi:uncharacterized protein affecting Mg2+/Co2+ transport